MGYNRRWFVGYCRLDVGAAAICPGPTGWVGGITRARLMRDACAALKVPMYIQDPAGTSIVEAAIAYVAHSTPPRVLLAAWEVSGMIPFKTAEGQPTYKNGRTCASDGPGLGVTPLPEVLGKPVAVWA
jgi:L-alanine-DL-glutamate epimerase-like enolase superfamily enzyme